MHELRDRDQDWDRLAVVGADVARLEQELESRRVERQALIVAATKWNPSDTDIATRGRTTRQTVHKIRNKRLTVETITDVTQGLRTGAAPDSGGIAMKQIKTTSDARDALFGRHDAHDIEPYHDVDGVMIGFTFATDMNAAPEYAWISVDGQIAPDRQSYRSEAEEAMVIYLRAQRGSARRSA